MPELDGLLMSAGGTTGDIVDSALETVRRHLGMEVAYLSEFVGDNLVFRAVSAPGREHLAKPGDAIPLEAVYCRHILEKRLPNLIRDTAEEPLTQSIAITHSLPIGSHVSVPVRRADGSVYGMFCCISHQPNPTLTDRDLQVMELFASISEREVNAGLAVRSRRDGIIAATRAAMEPGGIDLVFQPICDLRTRAVTGFEVLSRFRSEPYRTPDVWFADAAEVGLGAELEVAVLRNAVAAIETMPGDVYLSVNASPGTVTGGGFAEAVKGVDLSRIVLEVTEQAMVQDHDRLNFALDDLREAGLRVAVDDAGAGYAGLQQILRLRPDIIKLDMSLTRDVDHDAARSSLAQAMVLFADQTGALIVAEGIEREGELAALRDIGVGRGQGWLLGRPMTLSAALDWAVAGHRRSA
jgi:EAL domain-containing protein (putative c-di-GMP-specific phosphodiesterase class I)